MLLINLHPIAVRATTSNSPMAAMRPVTRPDPARASDADWVAYIYLGRQIPRDRIFELWQHHAACRAWIKVARDTVYARDRRHERWSGQPLAPSGKGGRT